MKNFNWRTLACGAAVALWAAMPASAALVTFEDVVPNLFADESFTSGGQTFTTVGFFGSVDTAEGSFATPPSGSDGQYYSGLNDSKLRMTSGGVPFRLWGFEFAFVGSPIGTGSPGRLVAEGIDLLGNTLTASWDFGAPSGGSFAFRGVEGSDLAALGGPLSAVTFYACIYSSAGGVTSCVNPARDVAQFALDNLNIPEPASLALVLGALGVAGFVTRRRQSV